MADSSTLQAHLSIGHPEELEKLMSTAQRETQAHQWDAVIHRNATKIMENLKDDLLLRRFMQNQIPKTNIGVQATPDEPSREEVNTLISEVHELKRQEAMWLAEKVQLWQRIADLEANDTERWVQQPLVQTYTDLCLPVYPQPEPAVPPQMGYGESLDVVGDALSHLVPAFENDDGRLGADDSAIFCNDIGLPLQLEDLHSTDPSTPSYLLPPSTLSASSPILPVGDTVSDKATPIPDDIISDRATPIPDNIVDDSPTMGDDADNDEGNSLASILTLCDSTTPSPKDSDDLPLPRDVFLPEQRVTRTSLRYLPISTSKKVRENVFYALDPSSSPDGSAASEDEGLELTATTS